MAAVKKEENVKANSSSRSSCATRQAATACKDTNSGKNIGNKSSKRKRRISGDEDEEQAHKKAARKEYSRQICSAERCTNYAQNGRVCIKQERHGLRRSVAVRDAQT